MSPTMRALLSELSAAELEAVRRGGEAKLAGYLAADGSLEVPGMARAVLAIRPA
jgi:hypothetical protein